MRVPISGCKKSKATELILAHNGTGLILISKTRTIRPEQIPDQEMRHFLWIDKALQSKSILIVILLMVATRCFAVEQSGIDLKSVKQRHYSSRLQIKSLTTLPDYREIWTNRVLIIDSLTIPQGDSLIIKSPTQVLFEPQGKIIIEGKLIVKGSSSAAVQFSPLPFSQSYEYAFDESRKDTLWHGLVLRQGGKLFIDTATFRDALFGIDARDSLSIVRARCVTFNNIKNASDIRAILPDTDSRCVNFSFKPVKAPPPANQNPLHTQHNSKNKNAFYVSATATIIGCAGYIIFNALENDKVDEGKSVSSRTGADQIRKDRNRYLTLKSVSLGVAGISGVSAFLLWRTSF